MKHVEDHFLACWPAFTEEVDEATECQIEWQDESDGDDGSAACGVDGDGKAAADGDNERP